MKKNNALAPIVLFVYNRPWHTQQTLESLINNVLAKDSVLYIYADGPKADATEEDRTVIQETRAVLRQQQWCGSVYINEQESNKGLEPSVIDGVTEVVNKHGKIIVLEDDIVTSPGFLQYMNDALELYAQEEKVMHIAGFVPVTTGSEKLPETYLIPIFSSWGWGTWKRAWDKGVFDSEYLYKKLITQSTIKKQERKKYFHLYQGVGADYTQAFNTWDAQWYASVFIHKGLCLYPRRSLVNNVGLDGSGVHCLASDSSYEVELLPLVKVLPIPIKEHKYGTKYVKRFYKYGTDACLKRRLASYFKVYFFLKICVNIKRRIVK